MKRVFKYIVLFLHIYITASLPYDDGKYSQTKYKIYDDGKYYRSLDEGKYTPGDEGKYTYVYVQGLYPTDDGDYRYIHKAGPDGGFGKDNPYRGQENEGREGRSREFDGSYQKGPNAIEYIGKKNYAERFPYVHKVIEALVEKYVSTDSLYGESTEGSVNHFSKVYADKEVAVKCHYMNPENQNDTEFTTQYPPRLEIPEGERLGSFYSFKGTKVLNDVKNSLSSKTKLEYEVIVRIVEDVSDVESQ